MQHATNRVGVVCFFKGLHALMRSPIVKKGGKFVVNLC
jgi:hypothetical protein